MNDCKITLLFFLCSDLPLGHLTWPSTFIQHCILLLKILAGPSAWHKSYPIAQGARQSPINIVPEEAVYDSRLPGISLSYENCTSLTISNNGHSVVVEFEDMDDRSGWCQSSAFCLEILFHKLLLFVLTCIQFSVAFYSFCNGKVMFGQRGKDDWMINMFYLWLWVHFFIPCRQSLQPP